MAEFGPRSIRFTDILLNSLGALIGGFIGSIIIISVIFLSSKVISINETFESARVGGATGGLFPFVLSFVTFIASMISVFISTKLLTLTDPEKYSNGLTSYNQIAFYGVFSYLCLTPLYLILGSIDYDALMILFIIHVLVLSFGVALLTELMASYRYILVGLYGSFLGLFAAGGFAMLLFYSLDTSYAKLVSLLVMLPLIQILLTFFRGIFEWIYKWYYDFTNLDPLGDIFKQIEREENETLREQALKNSL